MLPTSSPPLWFLVHTKPQQEELALLNLRRQGYTCYLPHLQIEKLRRQKLITLNEPLFPRYLFVQEEGGNGKSWWPIRSTLGVSNLVHFGSQPAKVEHGLIEWLKSREEAQATQRLFAPGDRVVITEGPFAGIEAIYQTTSGERRSLILIDILSKSVPMQIDPSQLQKIPQLSPTSELSVRFG